MSKLLIVAFENHEAEALTGFAAALGMPFDILSLAGPVATNLGADQIMESPGPVPPADALAPQIAGLVQYSHVAAVSSMQSKDVLARAAGLAGAAMVTDVISLEGPTVFKRPVVAGSMIATVEVLAPVVYLTVRPAGFGVGSKGGSSAVTAFQIAAEDKAIRKSRSARTSGRPDLTQAKVVVTGGRPLKDAETFEKVIGGLADKLGAAVGATRAAVDSGIAPNEAQVGQTGKIVAPDLYIAAGVSGSTQHMAGIKDSKVIVAINKDAEAPIFEIADFGLVADLFDAIPELMSKP